MNSESFNGITSLGKSITSRFISVAKRLQLGKKPTGQENQCSDGCCTVVWKPIGSAENIRKRSS